MSIVISGSGTITGLSAGGLPNDSVTSSNIASLAATKLTGQVPDANAPSGSVIQTVGYNSNAQFYTTGSGTIDVTGFSASITPTSSSNNILVLVSTKICGSGNGHYQAGVKRTIGGSSTNLALGQSTTYNNAALGGVYAVNSDVLETQTMFLLDTPATTSSCTYSIYLINNPNNGTGVGFNRSANNQDTSSSSIILLEIAP